MTLSDRIEIEKGLSAKLPFAEIARTLGKSPGTISKEVRKHTQYRVRKDDAPAVPCSNKSDCKIRYLCRDSCALQCKMCRKPGLWCSESCPAYLPVECKLLLKAPYTCNGCGKRINHLLEKKIYSAKYADDSYRETLISSREGINQTTVDVKILNDLITPLLQKDQSIAHIYDLRRRVKYKPQKKTTQSSILFYCNPHSSWQKGMIEKNHEYIRYVIPN